MTRFIYILTNKGIPHYIGKTNNPKGRLSFHKRNYPGSLLDIIDEVPSEEWRFWERHYISLYRSWGFKLDNKKLYAGNGSDIVSEETRKKRSGKKENISFGLKKFYSSQENRNIIKEAWKNNPDMGMKNKNHSDETREKMSLLKIGRNFSHPNKRVSILQYTRNGKFLKEWNSIKEAQESLSLGNIGKCCQGNPMYNSVGGFIWKYKNIVSNV